MYQGTTPSIIYNVKAYDLTSATIFVDFKRGDNIFSKDSVHDGIQCSYSIADNISTVVCELSQEDTLAIKAGGVISQIRFIYEDGSAYATNEEEISVKRLIYPRVIQYGGGDA